jgi:hypothetical protein
LIAPPRASSQIPQGGEHFAPRRPRKGPLAPHLSLWLPVHEPRRAYPGKIEVSRTHEGGLPRASWI